MIGRLNNLIIGKGEQYITLAVKGDFRDQYDALKDAEVDVEITKHHPKRSKNANAYCWVLCEKIAEALGDGTTKEEIYRASVKEVGVCKAFGGLSQGDMKTLETAWSRLGIGWITERLDDETLLCYYGSSEYNSKQMGRLVDNLVQDAKAQGITTETPEEIARMKALWGEKEKKQ